MRVALLSITLPNVARCLTVSTKSRVLTHRPFVKNRNRQGLFANTNQSSESDANDDFKEKTSLEEELDRLQQTLTSIEALEERNKAQLDSFIDEEDQWNSLEDFERELLRSKKEVTERMEKMAEELMQLWIGAKSMEG